jgi:hypothetical protein
MPSLIPDVAAFERRLAGLPVVKHPAHEVVLTAGSKTGRLLFLKSGAVEVIKDGVGRLKRSAWHHLTLSDVRFWPIADIPLHCTRSLLGQSRHRLLQCKCSLLTQSGHEPSSEATTFRFSLPAHTAH